MKFWGLIMVTLSFAAQAQERLPTIPPSAYDEAQKKAAEDFLAARKTPVFGPFEPLIYSPELMSQARAMGDYLRFKSALGNRLSELVILLTARDWTQDYEWHVHAPIAAKTGISEAIIQAIRDGRRPVSMSADETIVYDMTMELLRTKRVSNESFANIEQRFGKQGAVDLAGIVGYYSFLALELNMAQYRVPKDGTPLPRFPE